MFNNTEENGKNKDLELGVKETNSNINSVTNYETNTISESEKKIVIKDDNVKNLLKSGFNNSSTYFDIILFNCYNPETNQLDLGKLDKGIDDIVDVYQALFSVSMSMSSFQFIGLFLQSNGEQIISLDIKFAYFILSVGFMISLFGVLLSFIAIEYLKGIRDENPEFIIVGINHYKSRFKLADNIIYLNCACFVLPVNILIYKNIGTRFGIVFNVISSILFFLGIYFHYDTIIKKQNYNYVYDNNKSSRTKILESLEYCYKKIFSYFISENNDELQYSRKIYKIKKN